MILLIGSQNFGYNTEQSDKDWMEFIYPTWNDIITNNRISKEHILPDGTHIKSMDIRLIDKIINDGHISSLQFMFSTEHVGCEDLKWFIENRQRLCRASLHRAYDTSNDLKKKHDSKTLTRAYVFYNILSQMVSNTELSFYISNSYEYRIFTQGLPDNALIAERDILLHKLSELGQIFKHRPAEDKEIKTLARAELVRLLKLKL